MTLSHTLIVLLEFSSRIADRRSTNDSAQCEQAVLVLKLVAMPKGNCYPETIAQYPHALAQRNFHSFSNEYYSHKVQGRDL